MEKCTHCDDKIWNTRELERMLCDWCIMIDARCGLKKEENDKP
jgi:hypothetical protein